MIWIKRITHFMILNCWSYLKIVDTEVSKYTICFTKFHINDLWTSNEFELDFMICKHIPHYLESRYLGVEISLSSPFIMLSVASLLTICAVASLTLLSVAWKACLPRVDVNLISSTWCFVRNWLTFFSLGVGLNRSSFWIYENQSLEHG